MSTDPGPSIAAKCRDVRQGLTDLTSYLEEHQQYGKDDKDYKGRNIAVKSSAALDALERFTLWAGNMGAMRLPSSKLSLDQRLSEAPEVQELVCQLLNDLHEALEDLLSIVKSDSENRKTACDIAFDSEGNAQVIPSIDGDEIRGHADEASMILNIISECITSLFRTGILIRKAGTTDRFKRALQMSTATFHQEFDIDYVREKHPKLKGRAHATSGFPERLGNAMSKRRQFIKYSRDHRARLAYEEPMEPLEDRPARTEQLSSKATSLHPERLPAPSLFPTAVEEEEEEDVVSVMSASTLSDSASTLKLPRLEDLSPNGAAFECPICFTLQSFRREKAWRIHAFRDLKAYVCTVGGKDCESELFGDRNSWFEHETQCHRSQYTCILCAAGPVTSQSAIESHISGTHGPFPPEQLEKLQDASRQTLTHFRARDCPFCDDWAEKLNEVADPKGKRPVQGGADRDVLVSATRFKRHVAIHQEQLAIFVIPRAVEESGTPDSGSVGSLSAVKSLRSIESEEPVHSPPQSLELGNEQHDVDGGGHPFGFNDSLSVEFPVGGSDPESPSDPARLSAANLKAQTTALDKESLPEGPGEQNLWKSRFSILARRWRGLKSKGDVFVTRRPLKVLDRARRTVASFGEDTRAGTRGEPSMIPPSLDDIFESSENPGLHSDEEHPDRLRPVTREEEDVDRHSHLNIATSPGLVPGPEGQPNSSHSAYAENPRPPLSYPDQSLHEAATSPVHAEPDSPADASHGARHGRGPVVFPPKVGNSSYPKLPLRTDALSSERDTIGQVPRSSPPSAGGSAELSCPTCGEVFQSLMKLGEHFERSPERPFICVFAYAGCTSAFHIKNEWKRHVISRHIIPRYWICKDTECVKVSPRTGELVFSRMDLYTNHVRRMHVPEEYREAVRREEQVPGWDRTLIEMQASAERRRCNMPTYMQCPEPACFTNFVGSSAWDDRMEHVAKHIQGVRGKPNQQEHLFGGGSNDVSLTRWAMKPDVSIVRPRRGGWELVFPTWFPAEDAAPPERETPVPAGSRSVDEGVFRSYSFQPGPTMSRPAPYPLPDIYSDKEEESGSSESEIPIGQQLYQRAYGGRDADSMEDADSEATLRR